MSRGAKGATGDGDWERGVPLPTGEEVWGEGSAPSLEIFFGILGSKWRIFVHSWC